MKEEYRDLQKKKWQEAAHQLAGQENLQLFFKEIMNNFAHRYLANDATPSPTLIMPDAQTFRVSSIDMDMKSVLKTTSNKAREGIIELIKIIGLKNSPAVQYTIDLKTNIQPKRPLEIHIECGINWDFPSFPDTSSKSDKRIIQKKYSDFIELRNDLARVLDTACEIF
jgi:hypothetical protein